MDATPPPVTAPELATLDQELGSDSAAVIHSLASRLEGAGRVSDLDVFVEAVLAREALGSTVLPGGIAMPHARSHAVTAPSVAAGRLPDPVSFAADSDPVRLVLLIAAPGDDSPGYLELLQRLATACVLPAFVTDLAEAETPGALADLVGSAAAQR